VFHDALSCAGPRLKHGRLQRAPRDLPCRTHQPVMHRATIHNITYITGIYPPFMFIVLMSHQAYYTSHGIQLKASVEEEVNVHRSKIEKNAFKVFKLKQLVSCLILTFSSQEKDR